MSTGGNIMSRQAVTGEAASRRAGSRVVLELLTDPPGRVDHVGDLGVPDHGPGGLDLGRDAVIPSHLPSRSTPHPLCSAPVARRSASACGSGVPAS